MAAPMAGRFGAGDPFGDGNDTNRQHTVFQSPADAQVGNRWQMSHDSTSNRPVTRSMQRDSDRRHTFGVMEESPVVREEMQSRALRRSVNVQRTLGIFNQATGSSLHRTARTPARQLRHTAYTPKAVASSSKYDVSATLRTPGPTPAANLSYTTMFDQTGVLSSFVQTGRHSDSVLPDTPGMVVDDMTMTSNFLMEDDPGIAATASLFDDFFQCYRRYPSSHEVFELVSEYEKTCIEHIELLDRLVKKSQPSQNKFSRTLEIQNLMIQEKNMWRLLGSLYQDRLQSEETMEDDSYIAATLSKNLSEKQVAELLYSRDSHTRQSQVVIDWLERNAADQLEDYYDKVEFYSQTVSWENTLHILQQKKADIPSAQDRPMVTSMDPDAPIRQGKPLADLDKEDEVRLLRNMFANIQAGRLEEAQRLCRKCGQAWRAATLEGWKMYHDPNMDEVSATGELKPVEGNPHRDIWKAVCWRMAQEENIHAYEKAIYAALSGNLKELLPVCGTWEDCLWAYYKVMVDMRVEQEIREYFRDKSLEAMPSAYWAKYLTPDTIFQELQAFPNEVVQNEAKRPFHVMMKYIILGDVDGLTEEMNNWLHVPILRSSRHLICCIAHVVLFFRSVGLQTKEELCTAILEAYVKDLIQDKNTNLVATYTATLPPAMQVTCYAKFLEGIHERDERQRCLQLAEDAGLDIPTITKTVVENIRTRDDGDIQFETELTPAREEAVSEEDRHKIAAIDWLVFDPSQRAEALKQSNAVMRTFLATKKYKAARQVFNKMPKDSIDVILKNWQAKGDSAQLPAKDDNAIKEHICIKAYLNAHDAFNDWFAQYHNTAPPKPVLPPSATFQERVKHEHDFKQYEYELERWQYQLMNQSKVVVDHIHNVLLFPDGGWMVDQKDDEDLDDGREYQMVLLRQLCIPTLCFLLHSVLHKTKQYTEAVQIADIIASERHQLYKVFKQEELQRLLQMIRDSSLQLLDNHLDPLGY